MMAPLRRTAAACLAVAAGLPGSAASQDGFLGLFTGACPAGWTSFGGAGGRLLLAVNNSYQAGDAVGFPLSDGEDPTHSHVLSGSLQLPSKHVAALGGTNTNVAHQGTQPLLGFLNTSQPSGSGWPLLQLVVCRYSALSLQPAPLLPPGGVALWDPATATAGCPAGSDALEAASGRVLGVGGEPGWYASPVPALEPGQPVPHSHGLNVSVTLPETDLVGIDGCCDNDPAPAGTVTATLATGPAETGLPYLTLLTCNVSSGSGAVPPGSPPQVPAGFVLLSVAGAACPAGWQPLPANYSGRFIVGTPQYGVPGKAFGAAPFDGLGRGWSPQHSHGFQLTLDVSPALIALDSGCCAHGYGAAGTYTAGGDTDADVGAGQLPFFVAQACVQA